jgi:hypothetical protein
MPPEAKSMQIIVKYGIYAALAVGLAYGVTQVAPTYIDAINLITKALKSTTSMVVSGVVLVAAASLGYEILSPSGRINQLLRLPYASLINGLTRFFISIDPLSPITERLKAVRRDQDVFEKHFADLDGMISTLTQKEATYRGLEAKAQRTGQLAIAKGMDAARDVAAHSFGSYREAADGYAAMRTRLEPVRDDFRRIAEACDTTAQKLAIDRDVLSDKLVTSAAVHGMTDSAHRVLSSSKSREWAVAEDAEDLINTKYASELGRLETLKTIAAPFLQSIDLDTAALSDELMGEWKQAPKLVATAATSVPRLISDSSDDHPDAVANLIR